VIVAVLLIAGAIGAFVLFRGGNGDTERGNGGPPKVSRETPDFAFDMRFFDAVPSSTDTKVEHDGMQPVAANVTEAMNAYYSSAFLDPDNWSQGNYDAAWSSYDKAAVADAKEQSDVVTLGDAYTDAESVMPKPSTDSVKILLDPAGKPQTAVAQVTFGALVTGPTGEKTTVSTLGWYFLKPVGARDWQIYAFRIDRKDEPGDQVVGSPTPAPKKDKASPSAEATP
jgi:hypothetical protein